MARKRSSSPPPAHSDDAVVPVALLTDLRGLIHQARTGIGQAINSALVLLYWQVGHRIQTEILRSKRAGYGEYVVPSLAARLSAEFGQGFAEKNLRRMIQLAEVFADREIVVTLSRQLGWSHFLALLPLKDPLKRDFYAKRELAALRAEDRLTPDLVFHDPYFLDFLGLKDTYSEKDLEAAILRELESFILEIGSGFTFVARQKRIVIDGEDFYIDLLFYHRKLRRLVAIDLKLERFKAADKGQMELYLRWLEKHEMEPGEETPIGLILCENKGDEQIELLQLGQSGIRVASYMTELPPRPLLREKLHKAMVRARAKLDGRE